MPKKLEPKQDTQRGVFIKGDAKKMERGGVSWLANVSNTVVRFKSWSDASAVYTDLRYAQIYQGVPFTQEDLDIHYPELKLHTGLTKSKIGSTKVGFTDVRCPLAVQHQGHTYIVTPLFPDKWTQRLPKSMLKPKLTAEQQKYLDTHEMNTQIPLKTEIVFYHIGIEHAIPEAKRIEKQGHRVEIQKYAPIGHRPLYTILKVLNPQKAAKPKAATKPPRTPAASDMASVPVRLGGGGIPPIPGIGAAAAPKPKHRKFEGVKRCKDIFEFMRLYLQELKAHGITDKVGAEKLFNKLRLERFVPVEMTRESAIATIRAGIREGVSVGWFRCEDKGMKPHLFNSIVKEDAVRSAGLNLMHELYNILNSSNISFDKFLHKEITLYRGGEVTSDIFTSFSLDKSMAKKFVKQSKTTEVTKIRVKPIQTLGSYQTIAEAEVLVPRTVLHTLKKQTKAATKPPRTPAPSVPAILTPAPAAASGMATVQIGLGGGIPPIPGVGAAAAPKPKPKKKATAPKPKSKPKTAAKPAKGKAKKPAPAGITLTAAQKKRLAAKGSITIKRGGKFVTVRG